jgi:hypothetical protein
VLASASVWLQHRFLGRMPFGVAGCWALAVVAIAMAALIEWRVAAAEARHREAIDRTERAIGWGEGPYRVRARG